MDEKKYKVNTKSRLEKLADAGQRVLDARIPVPETPPAKGEEPQKKP